MTFAWVIATYITTSSSVDTWLAIIDLYVHVIVVA